MRPHNGAMSGQMVKAVINNRTTLYVNGSYQIADPNTPYESITKIYAGGAMRVDGVLYYTFGDHLGSTSITTDGITGAKIAEVRYKAWGEVRYQSGDTRTDKGYTGQRTYASDFGLQYYNARWYDTNLGRFAQADTICPISKYMGNSAACTVSFTQNITLLNNYNEMNREPQGITKTMQAPLMSESFDRYAYSLNNPTNHNDPSGHCVDGATTPVCAMFVPLGPIGWVVIGIITIVVLATATVIYTSTRTSGAPSDSVSVMEARAGSGGAGTVAEHLSMLMGGIKIAGFGPHPGGPNPNGDDKIHNLVGLAAGLDILLRNVDKIGRSLDYFLTKQGWTLKQIVEFKDALMKFTTDVLPKIEKAEPDMIRRINDLINGLLSRGAQ